MVEVNLNKRADGSVVRLISRSPFRAVKSMTQNRTLMSEDTVTMEVVSRDMIEFSKGDWIDVEGCVYKIRGKVDVTRTDGDYYQYSATFYGALYDLMKVMYRNTDSEGRSSSLIFDLTYGIKDFVKVIVNNMERDYPGEWTFDETGCPDTEPQTVNFNNQNCLAVLQSLCRTFDLDFQITYNDSVRVIRIGAFGSKVAPPNNESFFQWGEGHGLFTLKEGKVDDKAIVTRMYGEGGSSNIPVDYREYSERLQMPCPQRKNRNTHTLYDGTEVAAGEMMIGCVDESKRYIEDTELSAAIGVEEDSANDDSIYPKRTGKVTALVEGDLLSFIDDTMDFDLNERDENGGTKYLIAGTSAKVTFISGKLAGQEFELSKYDHGTKTFTIKSYTDSRGLTIPNEDSTAFRITELDEYKLTDINMPQSYIDNAEEDLWFHVYDKFLQAKQARAQYTLTFSRLYFVRNMPKGVGVCLFTPGDYVPIKDTRFGIEKYIRIQKVTRNLLLDHDYTLTIADTASISVITQTALDVIEHEKIIRYNRLRDLNRARMGWKTTEELRNMVYDTDGFFDTGNIRPNSIDTNMLTVGSRSQQFILTGAVLQANYGGDGNVFKASSGVLTHLAVSKDEVGDALRNMLGTDSFVNWNIAEAQFALESADGYYLFAKCSKNSKNGVWYMSQDQLTVEPAEDPDNYYFQVGILSSYYEDTCFRDFVTTHGFTRINGNTITTGKIVTSDGASSIDLDNGSVNLGGRLKYNVDGGGKLVLNGTFVQSGSGDVSKVGAWCGQYSSTRVYALGDEVWAATGGVVSSYRYINSTPGKGHAVTNTRYWTVYAKGVKGADGVDGKDGKVLYTWIKYADSDSGEGMSDSPVVDGVLKKYIGFAYNKETAVESDNASDYSWALFKGTDGENGVPGEPGTDGTTYYTWIKYADSLGGDGYPAAMYDAPTTSTEYIGIAVNKTTQTEGTDPSAYTWSKFKGDQGVPGTDGKDGADGKDGVDGKDGDTPYIGSDGCWWVGGKSTGKKAKGEDGETPYIGENGNWWVGSTDLGVKAKGDDGAQGPALLFRGVWDSSKVYYGNANRVDVVYYGNQYYVAKATAGTMPVGTLPTDTAYWSDFGASFDSVATGLLLAEEANIANFIFRDSKMVSQTGAKGAENLQLDGVNGIIRLGSLLALARNALAMFDSGGAAKVLIKNVSVGDYDLSMLKASDSVSVNYKETDINIYMPSAVTSYSLSGTLYSAVLGNFEEGDRIILSAPTVRVTVPKVQSNDTTIHVGTPALVLRLKKDGVVVNSVYSTQTSASSATSGSYITLAFPEGMTYTLPAGGDGAYSFDVAIYSKYGLRISSASGSGMASVPFQTSLNYSYTKANYAKTVIGNDGICLTFGDGTMANSGYLLFNKNNFAVGFNQTAFIVNKSGVFKSTNGGTTLTAL